jgi:hypothetical protein
MIIQLLKTGEPVLTARSAHRLGNSSAKLPIVYEGAVHLVSPPLETASADLLEAVLSLIARQHGLEMAGDYEDVMIKHNLRP